MGDLGLGFGGHLSRAGQFKLCRGEALSGRSGSSQYNRQTAGLVKVRGQWKRVTNACASGNEMLAHWCRSWRRG